MSILLVSTLVIVEDTLDKAFDATWCHFSLAAPVQWSVGVEQAGCVPLLYAFQIGWDTHQAMDHVHQVYEEVLATRPRSPLPTFEPRTAKVLLTELDSQPYLLLAQRSAVVPLSRSLLVSGSGGEPALPTIAGA